MDEERVICLRAAVGRRIETLRALGGIHCGTLRHGTFERVAGGFVFEYRGKDEGILLDFDILVRLNSRN